MPIDVANPGTESDPVAAAFRAALKIGALPYASAGVVSRLVFDGDGWKQGLPGIANIREHGAIADFDQETSGWTTDNAAAIAAAAASGDAIYAPTGDYYVSDATILRTKTVVGPGRFFTTYNGAVRQIGNRVFAGVCRQDVGDDLAGGLVIGEPGQGGFLLSAQNANYGVMQPVDNGMPMQWQLYSRNLIGTAISEAGGDGLTAVYRTFSLSPPWAGGVELVEVGDHIGFFDDVVRIKTWSPAAIEVETIGGAPIVFAGADEAVFRHVYQFAYGICDISGTTATLKPGQQFFGASANQKYLFVNGARHDVASVDSSYQVTLADDLGTINGAACILKILPLHESTTMHRLQSLYGSKEENVAHQLRNNGDYQISLQGTLRSPNFVIRSGNADFGGAGIYDHFMMTRDGKFGIGRRVQSGFDGLVEFYRHRASSLVAGGTDKSLVARLRSTFVGLESRYADLSFWNNYRGLAIQSYDNAGNPVITQLNPAGGGVTINSVQIRTGTGSPEGVVVGNVADVWIRLDGGAGTTWYVKESGTGNTGWTGK